MRERAFVKKPSCTGSWRNSVFTHKFTLKSGHDPTRANFKLYLRRVKRDMGDFYMNKLLSVMLCIAVIFLLIGILPVHGEEAVYDSVIRLHVLANSDSDTDQEYKLLVRDEVLSYVQDLLKDCKTREDAAARLSAHLDDIQQTAESCLTALGCNDVVSVSFGEENYPTRQYESCCFPSGSYLSLRVCIGEAAGQNWWCVLFPTLCLSAATEDGASIGASLSSLGLSGDQYRIITNTDDTTYCIRFKILEVIEDIVG